MYLLVDFYDFEPFHANSFMFASAWSLSYHCSQTDVLSLSVALSFINKDALYRRIVCVAIDSFGRFMPSSSEN